MILHHLREALKLAQCDTPMPRDKLLEALSVAEDIVMELDAQEQCSTLPPRLAAQPKQR